MASPKPPKPAEKDPIEDADQDLKKNGYGPFMRTREVSEALGITSKTIYKLVKNNELEARKLTKDLRFPRSSVARYIGLGDVKPNKPR